MFQALRQWWGNGRGKVTARLLLLELIVVVLGVFIAQALADWNGRRNALNGMELAKDQARRDLAAVTVAAVGWQRAIPCIDERMTAIMRMLSAGTPIEGQLLRRPAMQTMGIQLPDESEQLLLAQRYGRQVARTYASADRNAVSLTDQVDEIIRAWSGLARIDPANGAAGDSDRQAARQAAAEIKGSLRGIEINATNVRERAQTLGIEPLSNVSFRVIRDCPDLWRSGMTHPVVMMK